MRHVNAANKTFFYPFRNSARVWPFLSQIDTEKLAFVNAPFPGLPKKLKYPLQAASNKNNKKSSYHPFWVLASFIVDFKVPLLVFNILNGIKASAFCLVRSADLDSNLSVNYRKRGEALFWNYTSKLCNSAILRLHPSSVCFFKKHLKTSPK